MDFKFPGRGVPKTSGWFPRDLVVSVLCFLALCSASMVRSFMNSLHFCLVKPIAVTNPIAIPPPGRSTDTKSVTIIGSFASLAELWPCLNVECLAGRNLNLSTFTTANKSSVTGDCATGTDFSMPLNSPKFRVL
jgi:hypothetical protein